MSKSVGNVINPDEIIEKYGADVVRGYMMFMGPYEGDVLWNTETINGVRRFVSKYYRFLLSSWEKKDKSLPKTQRAVSKLIDRVEQDILNFKFNTTMSALMEFYNEYHDEIFSKDDLEKLIITTAPIFPHLAEEIWEKTGHEYSVHMQEWPEVKKEHLKEENVEIPVQINGKVRGKVVVSLEETQEEVLEKILSTKDFEPYLKNGEIKKFIYIPGKIANLVI
jgi:leucyl-tRNA synthetase